jgi:hypothetical protein
MNENNFIYDPDYNHWKEITEERDFQIEADFAPIKEEKEKFE